MAMAGKDKTGKNKTTAQKAGAAEGEKAEAPAPAKKSMLPLILLAAGLALGGGGASAYFLLLAPKPAAAVAAKEDSHAKKAEEGQPEFTKLERLMVPLVASDGKLTTYVSLDSALETANKDDSLYLKARLPVVRAAINEAFSARSYARSDNPRMVDLAQAERALAEAANKALDKPVVRAAHVTSATPI